MCIRDRFSAAPIRPDNAATASSGMALGREISRVRRAMTQRKRFASPLRKSTVVSSSLSSSAVMCPTMHRCGLPVSYTHLDVYKRQISECAALAVSSLLFI